MNIFRLRKIKNRIKKVLFLTSKKSYSQGGEDMILSCIFNSRSNGFYIDIGANHPTRASNTYLFYKKGWSGINIDALPEAIKLLNKKRKRDININIGVSDEAAELDFYSFKSSSYNTFNKDIMEEIKSITSLIEIKKIQVKPLSLVLDQYKIDSIDFLSVDVEGLDLRVLKSNDWGKYRPKVVIVEDFGHGMEITNSSIYKYMLGIDYMYFCQTCTNVFYIDQDFYTQRFKHN
jgi:FkbM family methyltransferase